MSGNGPEALFSGTAAFYLAYRSQYPDALVRRIAGLCGITPDSAVLDLGSGPGILARSFAPLARKVVCVDPVPEMIAAAREHLQNCAGQAEFLCASAHELPLSNGPFRVVAIGRAFHWMDRAATLRLLDCLVEPGGAVVLFRDPALKLPENAWRPAFDRTYDRYATTREAREGARPSKFAIDEAELLASPFRELERISMVVTRRLTIEMLIGRAYSMAGTSPADLGDRRDRFERAMARALTPFARDGQLTEITEPQGLIARRPDGPFPTVSSASPPRRNPIRTYSPAERQAFGPE